MAEEIFIARQDTLLEVKAEVEGGAKEATLSDVSGDVMAINGKIGNSADYGGTATFGTVMAKENAILTAVNKIGSTNDFGGSSSTGTVMAKENAILTAVNKIGSTNDTGSSSTTGTVMGKLNSLISASVIKSIQRGTVTFSETASITISSVNIGKSIILLDGGAAGKYDDFSIPYVYIFTSTSLRVEASKTVTSTKCSWQVIEFY